MPVSSTLSTSAPKSASSIEQNLCAQDVGAQKFVCRRYASINVGFGGEINYAVKPLREGRAYGATIGDITTDEMMTAFINILKIIQIAGITKDVKICNLT